MSDAIYSLGGVTFGLTGACMRSLRRSRAWRWAAQEVVGYGPRLSYLGPGETRLTLEGEVFPGQLGDADAPLRLEELADAAAPMYLVDSRGNAFGRWVIVRISRDDSDIIAGGIPRRVTWSMDLQLYLDDSDG